MGKRLVESAADVVFPIFEGEGFYKNRDGFYRGRKEFFDFLSVQLRSDGAAVALNAGVQPVFLIDSSSPDSDFMPGISEVDCFIRKRLTPEGSADYWFSVHLPHPKIIEEVRSVFYECGLPFFRFFETLSGVGEVLSVENIEGGKLPEFLSMMTRSRLALLCATINIELNRLKLAKEAAEYGLSVCGMAVSLKREFKNILSIS